MARNHKFRPPRFSWDYLNLSEIGGKLRVGIVLCTGTEIDFGFKGCGYLQSGLTGEFEIIMGFGTII